MALGVTIAFCCFGQSNGDLLEQADVMFGYGMTEGARLSHEEVLRKDTGCLESTVWLGNYYYLKGLEKRGQAEAAFRALANPNRMQTAFYQEQLKAICQDYFVRADSLLQRALRKQDNDYLRLLASDIEAFRIRVGISSPKVKKKTPVFKLFRLPFGSTVLP